MPYDFYIDTTVNCVFFRDYGPHKLGVKQQSMAAMIKHPDYKVGMNILRDIRDQPIPPDVTYKSISDQAQKVVLELDAILGECRWATLVGDAQNYAKIHQFIVTGRLSKGKVERKPFHDIDKAMEWLGLPKGYEIKFPSNAETG